MNQSNTNKNHDKENAYVPTQPLFKTNLLLDDSLIAQLPRRTSITSEDDDSMDERLFCQKRNFQKERDFGCDLTILLLPCL